MTHSETVPTYIVDDEDDGDGEIEVSFKWTPGQAPSGLSGPADYADPGYGEEFEIVSASVVTPGGKQPNYPLNPEVEASIIEYLEENWDRPDAAADHADYLCDQRHDDRMEDAA